MIFVHLTNFLSKIYLHEWRFFFAISLKSRKKLYLHVYLSERGLIFLFRPYIFYIFIRIACPCLVKISKWIFCLNFWFKNIVEYKSVCLTCQSTDASAIPRRFLKDFSITILYMYIYIYIYRCLLKHFSEMSFLAKKKSHWHQKSSSMKIRPSISLHFQSNRK